MHHAAAENLQPLIAFADPDLVADLGVADIDFHRRLGEVARAKRIFTGTSKNALQNSSSTHFKWPRWVSSSMAKPST